MPAKIEIPKEELERLYWKEGMSLSKIARKLNAGRSTLFYMMKKNKIKLRSRVEALHRDFSFSPSIDDLGYIIGVLHGDGCISKTNQFSLTVKDLDFLNRTKESLAQFKIFPKTHTQFICEKNYYGIKFRRNKLIKILSIIKPEDLNNKQRILFLNAMFDSEGCVRDPSNHTTPDIRLAISNQQLIEFISKELNTHNITHTITIRPPQKRGYKKMFHLRIGANNAEKFSKLHKFSIKRKQDRLDDIVRYYKEKEVNHA